jgi:hypothetical protein
VSQAPIASAAQPLRVAACRGSASTILALLLGLASVGFAVRAIFWVPPKPVAKPLTGIFTPEAAVQARALTERLARGIMALQSADGGFELASDGQYSYLIERVASSAFATAALAALEKARTPAAYPSTDDEASFGLSQALARGLDYLKKQQTETGSIGREEPKDHWSQVDATTAGVLAFAIAGRPQDDEALRGAAAALKRFSRGGLRNGWTRGLGVMTADRVVALGREEVFADGARSLADWRQIKQQPIGLPQSSDWNVAEAISRVVLGLVKGQDPFPGQVVLACLQEEDRPVWSDQSADCQAWWMQGWLVARSGSAEAHAWYAALLRVLAEEAIEDDNTVHGGWYANSLSQSSAAILVLLEGLTAQVISP